VSVTVDVRYNAVKGYSRKYTIEYIANTRNKHINTQCVYTQVSILGFFFILNSFLNNKSISVPHHLYKFTIANSQILSVITRVSVCVRVWGGGGGVVWCCVVLCCVVLCCVIWCGVVWYGVV
jgi:hypothetical protein